MEESGLKHIIAKVNRRMMSILGVTPRLIMQEIVSVSAGPEGYKCIHVILGRYQFVLRPGEMP